MDRAAVIERAGRLDTAALSDALDALGLPCGQGGLVPLTLAAPVAGFAVTVAMEPYTPGDVGPHILTAVVAAAGPDDVLVIDNQGRTDVSTWGGILSLGASRRGVRGVLVDGACRDVEEIRSLGLPVYGRASTPVTARGRLQQRCAGEPVTVAGRVVAPGDLVVADATGFVVVPQDRIGQVLTAAEAVAARERAISAEVRAGADLPAAMHDARLAGQA